MATKDEKQDTKEKVRDSTFDGKLFRLLRLLNDMTDVYIRPAEPDLASVDLATTSDLIMSDNEDGFIRFLCVNARLTKDSEEARKKYPNIYVYLQLLQTVRDESIKERMEYYEHPKRNEQIWGLRLAAKSEYKDYRELRDFVCLEIDDVELDFNNCV